MATIAVASSSRSRPRSAPPLTVAGPPRGAVNVSPRSASCTTAASAPSASSQAMLTAHCGMPKRKLIVPSSGSTIQRSPLSTPAGARAPPSSPRIASPGRAAVSCSRISRSAARSASLTRSVGVLLARSAVAPAAKRSRRSAPAARAASSASARSSAGGGRRAQETGGRRSAHGRSASICAGEREQRRLVVGARDELHGERKPVAPQARRHGRRGLARLVPQRGEGDHAGAVR